MLDAQRRACADAWRFALRSTLQEEEEAGGRVRLRAAIIELSRLYPRYWYRRITALLQTDGWRVNHKRVARIRREEGLQVRRRVEKRRRLYLRDGSCVR